MSRILTAAAVVITIITPSSNGHDTRRSHLLDDLHWERADPSAARVAFLRDRRPPFSPRLTSLSFRKKIVSKNKNKKTKRAKEAVLSPACPCHERPHQGGNGVDEPQRWRNAPSPNRP